MKYKLVECILKISNCFKKNKNKCTAEKYTDNNRVVLIKQDGTRVINPKIQNLQVFFRGKNNYIEFQEPLKINNTMTIIAYDDDSVIKFGKNFSPSKLFIGVHKNSNIEIGTGFTCMKGLITAATNTKIAIGNECMFATYIVVRSGDMHTIYDKDTNEILNPDEDTIIGDHVWVAYSCQILKGSKIPSNCVVGAESLVNKKFEEENCIIAGCPAKVIRRNIGWDKRSPSSWSELVK